MTLPEPLTSFWRAWGELNAVCRPTWWGQIVTDSQFPLVWESNRASIFHRHAQVSVRRLRESLVPALRAAGAAFEHAEFWDPPSLCPALEAMRTEADHTGTDADLVFRGRPEDLREFEAALEVRELRRPGKDFWRVYADSRREFGGEVDEQTLSQLVRRDRDVLVPAGLRVFAGYLDGDLAGFSTLISLAGVGYVDNVVTLAQFRRRGVGSATTSRAVRASLEAGDRATHLLTENESAPQRLYERLGFTLQALVESVTRRLPPE